MNQWYKDWYSVGYGYIIVCRFHYPKKYPIPRYTPSQQGESFNSGAKQRVIRMVEAQKDPMSPPRFKINKKIPRGPPSPPAPVMHSPTRKVTVKEQQVCHIPRYL
jgi:hypothetical protein